MIILQSLYYFLPAYFSNMVPVIFKKFNFLFIPVDFNKTFAGKPIFGKNKTWGGLIYGILAGMLLFMLQKWLYQFPTFRQLSLFDYNTQTALLGFTLASGALFGDLAKSFLKRRLGKKPGESWIIFDQIDLVIGAFALSLWVYIPQIQVIIILILITPILHYLSNIIAYYFGLKNVKW